MQKIDFYQSHLDGVSRSFAFCIQRLQPPYRQWVSLSYLLCRVLDTVEDAIWNNSALQDAQFVEFHAFMAEPPTKATCEAWAARFPSTVVESEMRLLGDSFLLFQDLHEMPASARKVIQSTVGQMYEGMRYYARRSQNGSLRLNDLTDVNRYCYFVAGVVGELLSKLYLIYRPDFMPGPEFHQNALHFGLFLQKVNLLKDQRSDEIEGRYLVPDRGILMASLRRNGRGAMDYLLSLPMDEKGYRTFCAWSLFLGAASLPWMQKAHESGDGTKIPRSVTQELLAAIESVVQDNITLENAFQEYLPFLPETEIPTTSDDGLWFRDLTHGYLASAEMVELGML